MPSNRVEALCAALDAEPLYHASLGSKELFHSNLIAWFVDHHPDAAREVFESWSRSEPGTLGAPTDRERRHLDLVIRLQDLAPLVIENKVFSPPRDKQAQGVRRRHCSPLYASPQVRALEGSVALGRAEARGSDRRSGFSFRSCGRVR